MLAQLGPAARVTVGLGVRDALSLARNFSHFTWLSADACIYPGVENLLLAARSLGLGASLATWHLLFEQEFKQILTLPPEVDTYAVVPIGYPLGIRSGESSTDRQIDSLEQLVIPCTAVPFTTTFRTLAHDLRSKRNWLCCNSFKCYRIPVAGADPRRRQSQTRGRREDAPTGCRAR